MKRYITLAAATVLGAGVALCTPAFAQTPSTPQTGAEDAAPAAPTEGEDTVIATIGDTEIYESELAYALSDLDPQFGQLPPEQRRVAALSALIDIKLLARKAEEEGTADSESFQKRVAFLRDRALHNAYFQDEILAGISDEDVRARYDQEVEATPPAEEVNARHILVETEEEATALIEELDGGADFAELAEENSTDGSAANGGDLGYFQRGQMVGPFEEAAFALEPGSYTEEPVQSQFGWHVIKVEDRREAEPPAFEQVTEQVRQIVLRERYLEVLQEERGESGVEIVDPELQQAYEAVNNPAAAAEGEEEPAADEPAEEQPAEEAPAE
ncbi:peptidylprolyl isomerase [Pararhizobium haloflavum]|uniref:peptidylprolyl isomerase n=1 Tax=Pararhizobium haloflavum TaxID=2037914 RepID=UPI000C19380A|nr:peptidylprolyl isomerase [Pararhizobium haloflavum]